MSLGNPDQPVGGLAVRTPPGVELRPLGRDDFPVALDMAREMYGLRRDDSPPSRSWFDALVNSPDATPFLALADGEPAGMAIFLFRRRLGHTRFQGWLSDLFVRPAARGRGIGRALLMACIAEWRLRQGDSIMLEVGDRQRGRAIPLPIPRLPRDGAPLPAPPGSVVAASRRRPTSSCARWRSRTSTR